jgi:outer membrane protein assembly factor BamE (lipoprotein component of BamABCDE complex)
MRSLRSRWLLVAACLIVAAGIAYLALRSSSPISAANLNKIRPGMSRGEVEALLGGPAGDYRRWHVVYNAVGVVVPEGQPEADEYTSEGHEEWLGDEMYIAVKFDRAGRVESAHGLRLAPGPWYRRLQRWVPLPG